MKGEKHLSYIVRRNVTIYKIITATKVQRKREMYMHLYTQTIKSHPDSNNPKRKEHTAIVRAIDLWKAAEISTDANPRDQKQEMLFLKA